MLSRRTCLAALPAVFITESCAMNATPATAALVELQSPWKFEESLERIQRAIVGKGLLVMATIDHAAMAKAAGLAMDPATVVIYGNPRGGTPLMNAAPAAALDLPLRVLVRQTHDGRTLIAFHPIAPLMVAAGVPEDLARSLQKAQYLLADAFTD